MEPDTDQEMDRDSIVPEEGNLREMDNNRETQGDQTAVEIGHHFEGAPEMVCIHAWNRFSIGLDVSMISFIFLSSF